MALAMASEATLRGLPLPRPSVRIICLDVDGRVLLLQWQDPVTLEHLWEPPGGGIEGDETAFAAAQRELHEETGLDPARIHERSINVERDTTWKGQRYVGAEPFFIAHFDTIEPNVTPAGLSTDEEQNLRDHRWCIVNDLAALDGRLEPPELTTVIDELRTSGSTG